MLAFLDLFKHVTKKILKNMYFSYHLIIEALKWHIFSEKNEKRKKSFSNPLPDISRKSCDSHGSCHKVYNEIVHYLRKRTPQLNVVAILKIDENPLFEMSVTQMSSIQYFSNILYWMYQDKCSLWENQIIGLTMLLIKEVTYLSASTPLLMNE